MTNFLCVMVVPWPQTTARQSAGSPAARPGRRGAPARPCGPPPAGNAALRAPTTGRRPTGPGRRRLVGLAVLWSVSRVLCWYRPTRVRSADCRLQGRSAAAAGSWRPACTASLRWGSENVHRLLRGRVLPHGLWRGQHWLLTGHLLTARPPAPRYGSTSRSPPRPNDRRHVSAAIPPSALLTRRLVWGHL